MIGPCELVPCVATVPLQPPDAAQAVALLVDQVSVEEPPTTTEVGLADRVTVGGEAAAAIVTVTDCAVLWPLPVQVSVNVVLLLIAADTCVPDVPTVPAQPPEAAQLSAPEEVQVRVVVCPALTEVGLAERVTEGAASVVVRGTTAHTG